MEQYKPKLTWSATKYLSYKAWLYAGYLCHQDRLVRTDLDGGVRSANYKNAWSFLDNKMWSTAEKVWLAVKEEKSL